MPLTPEQQQRYAYLTEKYQEPTTQPTQVAQLTPQQMERYKYLKEKYRYKPEKETGFLKRVAGDIKEREEEATRLKWLEQAGRITRPEEIYRQIGGGFGLLGDISGEALTSVGRGLSKVDEAVLGGGGKQVLKHLGGAIGELPTIPFGGERGTLAETVPQEIGKVSEEYTQWASENPRQAGMLEATGNIALALPAIKESKNIVQSFKTLGKSLKPSDIAKMTSDDIKNIGSKMYQAADQKGGILSKDFVQDFARRAQRIGPQTKEAQMLTGEDLYTKSLRKIGDIVDLDQPLSFQALEEIDEALGAMAFDTLDNFGEMSNEGRKLFLLQQELRSSIDSAPSTMFEGGREAFDAVKEARKFWAAKSRMKDVERLLSKAETAEQPSGIIKRGMKRIEQGKSFKFYSPEEKFAIRKASKSGTVEPFLKLAGSGLVPIIAGGTGYAITGGLGAAAAIPAFGVQQASKMAASGMAARKARNVLNVIKKGLPYDEAAKIIDKEYLTLLPQERPDFLRSLREAGVLQARTTGVPATVDYLTQETPEYKNLTERARAILRGNK